MSTPVVAIDCFGEVVIMFVDLNEDEVVLLIQLLLPTVVAAERATPKDKPFQNQLLKKLHEAREMKKGLAKG